MDGEKYRWRVARRAITVEHSEKPGGVIRENLARESSRRPEPGASEPFVSSISSWEPITPARIAQLIRHARSRGWRPECPTECPTRDTGTFEIAPVSVWDDPRGRDHYDWARLLRQGLGQLERDLGRAVELGAFWWHGPLSHASGGLGARIRFGRCDVLPEADLWEAAFCISGNRGERAGADIFAFPFREKTNLGLDQEQNWIFSLQSDNGQNFGSWRSVGWVYWDGPGEWSYATEPGCIFYEIEPTTDEVRVAVGEPIAIAVTLDSAFVGHSDYWCSLHRVEESRRGAIVDMSAPGNWLSWAECPASDSRDGESSVAVTVDASRLSIAGGWQPGSYRVSVRVRAVNRDGEGQSALIAPVSVEIAP